MIDVKLKIKNKNKYTKKEEIKFNKDYTWKIANLKNEMHNYSLYNIFKLPKISLILINNNNNLRLNEKDTIKQLENILYNNEINIEIIIVIQNNDERINNLIKNSIPKNIMENNYLKLYKTNITVQETFTNLINIIQGTYIIFIQKYDILKKLKINQLFSFTKGKIENYFNIRLTNELNTYLFRSKILKNLNDNGMKFNSLEMILNKVESLPNPFMHYIPISLCPNNKYSHLAYVAMSSILSSKGANTYICFYLILPRDFEKRNYNFFRQLYEEYDYFNLTFIQMDERYDKAYKSRYITIQTYYRFSLGELLSNINKTIYIDTDIVVYKDLNNFYNLNFNGKIFLASPSIGNRKGVQIINAGILLMNLLKMRECKIENKVMEIINKVKVLEYHDQSILNSYFYHFIGFYPPEYHVRPLYDYNEIKIFNNKTGNIFDINYLYYAHKYPYIRHYLGAYKPKNHKVNHVEDWWFFARKSKYYNDSADRFENAFSF